MTTYERSIPRKQDPDELSEPFFSEVDEQGNMRPERLAEHSSSLELLSRWQDMRKQIEGTLGKRRISKGEQEVLRTMRNHETAMREAILLKGGIHGVAQELEGSLDQTKDNELVVKSLEDLSVVITPEALAKTDELTLQELSRLFGKASVYLRKTTPTLKVERLIPVVNKVSQLINKELRSREALGGVASYSSVEEARAARQTQEEVTPEEDDSSAEAVLEEAEEVPEEEGKQAVNGK